MIEDNTIETPTEEVIQDTPVEVTPEETVEAPVETPTELVVETPVEEAPRVEVENTIENQNNGTVSEPVAFVGELDKPELQAIAGAKPLTKEGLEAYIENLKTEHPEKYERRKDELQAKLESFNK